MNRRLYQFLYSSVPMLTVIDCRIVIGASGAVSSFTGNLIQSVVRDSIGHYTITLKSQANLNHAIAFVAGVKSPSDGSPSGLMCIEKSPSGSIANNPGTLVIQCFDDTDALANPASGSVLEILQFGSNSSNTY